MDRMTPERRSWLMAQVPGKHSKPEMFVRQLVFGMGYRYRLHDRRLPGKPDLVFPGRRKVILVHGCFWHGHLECRKARLPKTNIPFWGDKQELNRRRDDRVVAQLQDLGWRVLVVWQCELKEPENVAHAIKTFLDG